MGRKRKIPKSYELRPWYKGEISSDSDTNDYLPRPKLKSVPNIEELSEPPSQPLSENSFRDRPCSPSDELQSSSDDVSSSSSSTVSQAQNVSSHNESGVSIAEPDVDAGSGRSVSDVDAGSGLFIAEPDVDAGSGLSTADPDVDAGSGLSIAEPDDDAGSGLSIAEPDVDAGSGLSIAESAQSDGHLHDQVQLQPVDDPFDLESDENSDGGYGEKDYYELLTELANDWMMIEVDHNVSKTASNCFWRLSTQKMFDLFTAKKNQNIKKKTPQINQLRKKSEEKIPEISLEIGYIENATGELHIEEDLQKTPMKMFPPSEYTKAYEIASVKV